MIERCPPLAPLISPTNSLRPGFTLRSGVEPEVGEGGVGFGLHLVVYNQQLEVVDSLIEDGHAFFIENSLDFREGAQAFALLGQTPFHLFEVVHDGAVLEFVAASGEENLQDRIALLGEQTAAAPLEREVSLRLLRHLASSVHHQQYHDTDIVTPRVETPAASGGGS